MTELFINLSDDFKRQVNGLIGIAKNCGDFFAARDLIKSFSANLTEEQKNYIDFRLSLEAMNEDFSHQRQE